MTANELITVAALLYALAGLLCLLFAALDRAGWRMLLFSFFCWPFVGYYALRMLIGRLKG